MQHAGLDYPGVGPEHALLRDSGRATYTDISDAWAMQALDKLAKSEGILCAIETAHAFAGACDWGRAQVAAGRDAGDLVVVVNTSGRGDKDVDTAARYFGLVPGEDLVASEAERVATADAEAAGGSGSAT